MNTKIILILACMCLFISVKAQDSSRIFVTTGAGIVKTTGSLSKVLKPAIAFNSGLEAITKKGWFAQATLDFNTLKYDQQVKDEKSPYLFQNSNSSLLMIGLNGGKLFALNKIFSLSGYIGGGYANIGEPRAIVNNSLVLQDVIRKNSAFARGGARIAYNTPIKFLQTIYLDANWWTSPVNIQENKLKGFSFFIGTKMIM